ncbi:hypothetical protein GQ42DRAFT_128527 [Ramicandelaber brevisporus]|nr:hypothetical protein GQ42DRAFT_128527 [Ramicandelaber brevisporus]
MSSASASSSIVSELRKTSYERRWKHDRLVAIGLVLVIFAVGVPFWWITTTVYRAELPQTRVNNWKTYAKTHFMKSCPVYHVNIPASESDARRMRVYEYTNSYQLTFSLLGGSDQPEDIKDLDWDIEAAMTAYIQPFLDQLEPFAKFITDSQIQRYAKLPVTPQLAHNISAENELPQALLYIGPDGNDYGVTKQHLDYYYLTPKNLTHFISSSEWNLASTETTSPIINMVLYVPPRTHRPLYIHSTGSGDKPIANSAFLVPRWGGFFIHNGNSTTISFDELHTPMSVFVSQLRGLLGVPNVCSELARYLAATSSPTAMKSTIACQSATRSGISGWDLDSLFRRRAVANIASAVSTLDSVSNLLDQIPNIEAPDDIRNLMTLSLDRLDKALESFGIDDGPIIRDGVLDIAMKASGEAAEFAKQAFDHPDLVTQMYFPDEHKLAIYMPLFVPVFMPVIIALVKLFKERRDAKLKKQE